MIKVEEGYGVVDFVIGDVMRDALNRKKQTHRKIIDQIRERYN